MAERKSTVAAPPPPEDEHTFVSKFVARLTYRSYKPYRTDKKNVRRYYIGGMHIAYVEEDKNGEWYCSSSVGQPTNGIQSENALHEHILGLLTR